MPYTQMDAGISLVLEDPHDFENGGYKILDTALPRETDREKGMDLHEEYNENLGEAYDEWYEPNIFRVKSCREWVEPLLAALARSLGHDDMPALDEAELFTHLWWAPSDEIKAEGYDIPMMKGHRWGVRFIAGRSGEEHKPDRATEEGSTPPLVQWQVGYWRLSNEVMKLFVSLGQQAWLDFDWQEYKNTKDRDLLGNSQ